MHRALGPWLRLARVEQELADATGRLAELRRDLQRVSERAELLDGVGHDLTAAITGASAAPEPAAATTARSHSAVGAPARVVTVVTHATLPQARALARSLRRREAGWQVEAILVGAIRDCDTDPDLVVRTVEDALGLDPAVLLARHPPDELVTLLAPRLLLAGGTLDAGPIIHLPATAWIVGEPGPIVAPLTERPVLLAPRLRGSLPADGLEPSRDRLATAGRIAPDLIGASGAGAADFLRWWISRLDRILGSPCGPDAGLPRDDRRWTGRLLELAISRSDVATLDDATCNTSAWNLPRHTLTETPDGVIVDERAALTLIDFASFDPTRPFRLGPDTSRMRVSRNPALRTLTTAYAGELIDAGWRDVALRQRAGWPLANGLTLDEHLGDLLAIASTLGTDIGDPESAEGTRRFMHWLRGPAAAGGAHGVNRYLLHRVARQRHDVLLAFPDLDGPDGPRLVEWAHRQGRQELGIPEQLLPERGTPGSPRRVPAGKTATVVSRPPRLPATAHRRLDVRVSGYLGHVLGLGAAARAYVEALQAVAIPVSTMSVSLEPFLPPIVLEGGYGRHTHEDVSSMDRSTFELICVNPGELETFVQSLPDDWFGGIRIGVWGWESNIIPPAWAPAFELVDEIWVYSQFVAENLSSATDIPVIALPPPVLGSSPTARPMRLGVPQGFLFLFMFDYSSTNERKNPIGLIDAFSRAFAPGEGPQLLIKTINGPLLPLAEEEVLWAARGREDIHVVDCSLTREQRDALVATCDCYVSLHRSEGFGLTLAEAMALGKPVIATGYSGNLDFMRAANSFPVDYELTRVGPESRIYPADGIWAEPSVEHAAQLMRQVYERPETTTDIGEQARLDIARLLSPQATGEALRRRLETLAGIASNEHDQPLPSSR